MLRSISLRPSKNFPSRTKWIELGINRQHPMHAHLALSRPRLLKCFRVCWFALVCAVLLSGCTHRPKIVHVKGKVTFKNGPMPNAPIRMIGFLPTENSTAEIRKGASSIIAADGSYDVWTRKPGDGIYAGEYDVTFALQKGPTDPTSVVPVKYANRQTTPFKNVTVDKNTDDLNFEIDLAGGAGAVGR
jgi:hypothetical protein